MNVPRVKLDTWLAGVELDVANEGGRLVEQFCASVEEVPEKLRAMTLTSTVSALTMMLIESSDQPARMAAMLRAVAAVAVERSGTCSRTKH